MKYISTLVLVTICNLCSAQTVQLHYSGTNQEIIKAVEKANAILSDPSFYTAIEAIKSFDNTTYSGKQIVQEMNNVKVIEVAEYYKKRTKTNAITSDKINMNTAKLDRDVKSITNTLIHESIRCRLAH